MTTHPIPVSDPHVAAEDGPRLSKQSLAILAMLQAGPCTTRELMDGSGSLRVGARIKDIRDYGYLITTEMHMGGRTIYRLVKE